MELISSWSPDTVRGYLEGLEPSVQHYPFQGWRITGQDLLDLSPQHLDALGVRSIGHQEVFLEAVEQLCALHYELHSETLRSLTDKLHGVSQTLCSHIRSLRKASSVSQSLCPTQKQLAAIIDIVCSARGLFSWLNRYLFTRLNDYSASRDVIALCVELAEVLHKDWSDPLIEDRILAIGIEFKSTSSGQHFVCGVTPESPAHRCGHIFPGDEIIRVNDQVVVGWTQKNLVQKLQERSDCVDIVLKKVVISQSMSPRSPVQKKVHGKPKLSASHSAPRLPSLTDIPPSPGVSLTTHRVLLPAHSAPSVLTGHPPLSPQPDATTSAAQRPSSQLFPQSPHSWPSSVPPSPGKPPASILFTAAAPPPPAELPSLPDTMASAIFARTLTPVSQLSPQLNPQELKDRSRPRSGSDSSAKSTLGHLSLPLSPGVLRSSVSESNLINPTVVPDKSPGQEEAAAVNQQDKKLQKSPGTTPPSTERRAVGGATHSHKGSVTKLSRRRVSCKDLGRPDCDGWLWKRKENVGFMSQRWKRCWCVLKKDRLYWYSSAQDEKALGLLNISSYSLESPLEAKPKKKYEFQLSHPTYKPFVFAADNLSDMQKWVTFLLKALQKYKAPPSTGHSQEEDCYSETEAEDDDVRSHDAVKKPLIQSPSRIAPVPKVGPSPEGADGGHLPLQAEGGHSPQPIVDDDLKLMMTCLKQGGVSLIGKKTAMTRDEYRKSFIRRNKNPDINQKAHTLRVLQSTLKAKLLELQSLDQILDNPGLNSNLFQRWKSEHEHLYGSLGMSPPAQRAAASNTCPEKKNDRSPRHSRESEESD
ncbi:connector enhancer of kinase suppressor of ras 1 isoform X2 [Dendropsophus ebraccatus]|uniref:connector enhancer of kinase suppressor of ras 1 isoform X2 n=1 Tax=Dendropsophus ebraccatus TaxID=150705 RepID=UPI003831E53F